MKRQQYDVTQNSTVTINLANNQDLTLLLNTAGAGGYAVTFTGVDTWISPTGSAPIQPTAVGRAAEWVFFKANGVTYGEKTSETGPAGSAGATGPAGSTWRHTWSSATTYSANDEVYFQGSSYIALQASSSTNAQQPNLAPTYWDPLLAGGGPAAGSVQYDDTFVRTGGYPAVLSGAGSPFTYGALIGLTTDFEVTAANVMHIKNSGVNATKRIRAEQDTADINNWVQVQVNTIVVAAGEQMTLGLCSRFDPATNSCYDGNWSSNAGSTTGLLVFNVITNGAVQNMGGTFALTIQAGDILKMALVNGFLTYYKNGAYVATQGIGSSPPAQNQVGKRTGLTMRRQSVNTDITLSDFQFGV